MGKLVCIGGGEIPINKNGVVLPYETKEIDEEIVRLTNKENPKMLFIGTASSHSERYFETIQKIYSNLGAIVSNLDIINNEISKDELEKKVFESDIIYVGGGNTRFMLEKWREVSLDTILIEAYKKDIVLSGLSAGSYCWFKYNYDLIEGLGIIDAINCAHYNMKNDESKQKFFDVIKEKNLPGIAIDNCVAVEFVGGKYKVIRSKKEMNAYEIKYEDGNFIQNIIK